MAPQKNNKSLEDPPKQTTRDDEEAESSSSGEYETDSETGSSSDSETVEKETPKPIAVTKPASVVAPPALKSALKCVAREEEAESSSGEYESDSDSETVEKEAPKPASAVAPTEEEETSSSESEEEAPKKKKAASSTPVLESVLKRPASGEGTSTARKRAKTVEESGVKKSCIQRKWEDEDEIKLLKALIDFNANQGKSPFDNRKEFFELIKESFTLDPTEKQLTTKIRGLKDKFVNRNKRKEKKGVEPPFANNHEKECMILAHLIWGCDGFAPKSRNGKSKKAEKKAEKEVLADPEAPTVGLKSDWIEDSFILQFMVSRGLDEGFVKQEWSSATPEDKKIIEVMYKSWNKQKVECVQLETKVMNEFASRIFKST